VGDARNALHSRDSHIWTLRIVVLILSTLVLIEAAVIYTRQNDIRIHVPPDLSQGAVLNPGQMQKPNAFFFGVYVWRNLNDWSESGKTDYRRLIEEYSCLVTPEFKRWLLQTEALKRRQGELDRTRVLKEFGVFSPDFVVPLGGNVFSVAVFTRIEERVRGVVIKDVGMSYSLRVVPDTRKCNVMGIALDGFMVDPTRAEQEAEEKSKKSRGKSQ
jgi:integrating conjugative element protein (TIGR03746 family)